MGTPEFALAPLQALINDPEIEVQAVVTKEDKKVGRKQILTPPAAKILAIKFNIPVLQPVKLKNREFFELLKGLKPDFMVVVGYGKILPPEILEIPKFCCVNIHPSLLPKYRGATPVEEALLNGDTQTGVTTIKMDQGMDSGNILLTQKLEIKPEDSSIILYDKLFKLAAVLLPPLLRDYSEGLIKPIPQNHANATFCHKISKNDGLIDLNTMTAQQVVNMIRAYTPWRSCFLKVGDKTIKILEATADATTTEQSASQTAKLAPGQVVNISKNEICLGTKKGLLIPKKVQLEGKNPVLIQDFLRGYPDFFKKILTNPK